MEVLSQLTRQCVSGSPDGRPLHAYGLAGEHFLELEQSLRSHRFAGQERQYISAAFVFWACEHIRANFEGGPLTWEFVFGGIGWPEDQDLGRNLTTQGLQWWERNPRVSEAGRRMFLYSLMAEGGIPEALLRNQGLYRDVVLGALKEIEREGGVDAKAWVHDIAIRWIQRLPQTFNTADVGRLLAELMVALVNLRAQLPAQLPEEAAVRWLNQHKPDWLKSIPLRMAHNVAESLIHPVIQAERDSFGGFSGHLCSRELRLSDGGEWQGYLELNDDAWLPSTLFPNAEGLRLRLVPAGANSLNGVAYSGAPQEGGWQLRRFGSLGSVSFPFSPQEPLTLAAFADGRPKGEAVVDPGLPVPDESPTLWRAANPDDGASASRLVPVAGEKRTRAACLWVWAPEGIDPEIEGNLDLQDLENAPEGYLWRISGKGILGVGNKRFRVQTGSETEGVAVRLFAAGEMLPGWRLDGKTPVFRGNIAFYGQMGASRVIRIPKDQLRLGPSKRLFGEVIEWVRRDEAVASCGLVRIPDDARLDLHEIGSGCASLEADGLGEARRIAVRAGNEVVRGAVIDGSVRLKLKANHSPPGTLEATLSDPATGAMLCLQAPWPVREGVILDPDDRRLDRNSPLSVDSLHGWRAIVPGSREGELQLRLQGHRAIALPVANESSLAAHRPLVQAMLAQGGPDAQVNLSLFVGGEQSNRLELRRYQKKAAIDNGVLQAGLDWDKPISPRTSLGAQLRKRQTMTFHAVNMSEPEQCKRGETSAIVDVAQLLGETGDPWLIQTRVEGQIQRPVVSGAISQNTRAARIEHYEEEWRRLLLEFEDSNWERLERLMAAVREGGDVGSLDEVQALARVPAAALSLALRSRHGSLWEIQELDAAAPIFWPSVPVTDFEAAIRCEHGRLLRKLSSLYENEEATETADMALLRRIGKVLILMPEITAHFGRALVEAGIFHRALQSSSLVELVKPFMLPNPMEQLVELAQVAARRFDHLPAGVQGLELENRPPNLEFNRYAQAVVDAPLAAAEMAAGRRPAPDLEEKLMLINLRAVDPLYFNEALPVALSVILAGH